MTHFARILKLERLKIRIDWLRVYHREPCRSVVITESPAARTHLPVFPILVYGLVMVVAGDTALGNLPKQQVQVPP